LPSGQRYDWPPCAQADPRSTSLLAGSPAGCWLTWLRLSEPLPWTSGWAASTPLRPNWAPPGRHCAKPSSARLGMPAGNPEPIRQRASDAARRRSAHPATLGLDPVLVALDYGEIPIRVGGELAERVQRAEYYAASAPGLRQSSEMSELVSSRALATSQASCDLRPGPVRLAVRTGQIATLPRPWVRRWAGRRTGQLVRDPLALPLGRGPRHPPPDLDCEMMAVRIRPCREAA
jgi:hypothetical protein